tara:strand:+ start:112767 stop:112910 length:144 start_codon:yes stop_codon:yes gene_type:complete
MDVMELFFVIAAFYIVVFLISDKYVLPKLDRYLDYRNSLRNKKSNKR